MSKILEEVQAELTKLKAEMASLKASLQPNPPSTKPFAKYDPTANFSMPQSAIDAMTAVVGDNLMRDIVKDQRRGVSPPSSLAVNAHGEQPTRQIGENGWIDPRPLSTPYVDIVDRIAQGFAERERRER